MTHDTLEEALEAAVVAMEEEGVDFKEEVGCVFLSLPNREDLEITLYVVDKKVSEMFNKEELH